MKCVFDLQRRAAVWYGAMADKFVTLPEILQHEKKVLPRDAWNFGAGAAETEMTRKRNRRALDRLAIRQDILVDIREIDLSTRLLGVPMSWPVAVAPMGGLILFHPQGDLEMARGAQDVPALPSRRPRVGRRPHGTGRGLRLSRGGVDGRRAGVWSPRARHRPPLQSAGGDGARAQPARARRKLSRASDLGRRGVAQEDDAAAHRHQGHHD